MERGVRVEEERDSSPAQYIRLVFTLEKIIDVALRLYVNVRIPLRRSGKSGGRVSLICFFRSRTLALSSPTCGGAPFQSIEGGDSEQGLTYSIAFDEVGEYE